MRSGSIIDIVEQVQQAAESSAQASVMVNDLSATVQADKREPMLKTVAVNMLDNDDDAQSPSRLNERI